MYRSPLRSMMTLQRRGPNQAGSQTLRASIVPARLLPILRAQGGTYLGEDERYYYWMEPAPNNELGGIFDNIGNMFKRMVKFTPKSFTPGNIYEGFVNTTLTVASAGLYQALPSNIKKSVYEVGKVAIPVIAGGVLAYTAGPSVMAALMPKLTAAGKILGSGASAVGSLFGGGGKSSQDIGPGDYGSITRPGVEAGPGAVDKALTIGGAVIDLLNRLPQNKQAEVVERLTPEDIAYIERTGQIPPYLKDYFDQMAQSTFNPGGGASGSQALYDAYGQPKPAPVEAGFFGSLDMTTILLFAVPAAFYFLMPKSGRR